ncbi:ABC transporter permease [Nonomuraea sp. NPDC050404]|uniref:ABC transporter permease n=1 Tax=Nonomuraea sp. NPDC050404 TaxID=3155783 RepID=UPI0033E22B3D
MRHALKIFMAEALKQHRVIFGSRTTLFAMVLWPLMQLATSYYTVRPLTDTPGIAERWPLAAEPERLLAFLATGALAYAFFFSVLESSWWFSYERATGTLEGLFLTPANRLVLVLANGAGAMVQNTWLFTCMASALITATGTVHVTHPLMYAVVLLALVIPATAFGALINSILIFARDASMMFNLIEEPLWFATGVRLPLFALPSWLRACGTVLPLTGSLIVMRGALDGATIGALLPELALLGGLSAAFVALAAIVLRAGEKRAQRTGELRLS